MTEFDLDSIVRDHFGLESETIHRLPGEVDLNTFVATARGDRFVLKVHGASTPDNVLDMQDAVLAHIARTDPALTAPRVIARKTLDENGERRVARLLTWVDGTPVSGRPASPEQLADLGRTVARTDRALVRFEHAAIDRTYRWNMMGAGDLGVPSDPWAAATLRRFANDILPPLRELPQQAIHNDANDDNIVVDEHGSVALIDYGDVVRSPRIVGLGVAIAYAMLGQLDPLAAGVEVVAGYHEVAPLETEELELLDMVVRTRLAMSIAIADAQVREQPDNAQYLTTSQAAIGGLVELLVSIPPSLAHAAYRNACGFLPVAAQRPIENHFDSVDFAPAPIVEVDLAAAATIDWSIDAERTQPIPDDRPGLGRYGELRSVYDTDAFATPFGERRTLHLGIDVFVPSGTPVRSPLSGTVHSCAIRHQPGDYGGVVIIEYTTFDGTPFWMLLGHLAHSEVEALRPGDPIGHGAEVAVVGGRDENGGWAPHIHVQLFTDLLGQSTELDGVARASQREVWMSISPNPAPLLVGVDRRTVQAPHAPTTASIVQRRRSNLSPSLSLSYATPLHMVRGDGSTLIDESGRRWLDLVNNVAHVGHEHPRVVEAITDQATRLNTNTRYLHRNIVEYAQRLRSLFPDPLTTVFFTNSGSEAVDLALRLARTATGREGVLTLDWAYHGNLSSLVEISPYKFNRAGGQGRTNRVRICELPDPYRGVHGADGPAYADDVGRQARTLEASGLSAAAFVHESIAGCGGQIDLAPGYLEAAYAQARSAGALCIADEVQCGLGRMGADWWAFENQGVVPDIVTMGKPLGNGHPLGAVITTPAIARAFANGMEYFNTFGGNPVSCAAGLAVLDVIRDERLRANATAVGAHLVERLRALADRHGAIGDVRGRGLFVGIDLVEDPVHRSPATGLAADLVEAVRERGILISHDGPHDNVLKIKPPMVVTMDEIDTFVDVLDESLDAAATT